MVTENNSLINTFVKGMNSDTSYQMLDELSYALAENLRLFSLGDGNKHGELRPIPGSRTACVKVFENLSCILASTSIRQYGIIIVKLNDGRWRVYRFENKNNRSDLFEIFDPNEIKTIFTSKNTTESTKFDVVTRYEDDDNVKLYIADGNNPIMCLNITKEYGSTISEEDISSYPSALLDAPKFVEYVSGNIKAGLVQYSYRLYRKNSVASEISPCTTLIPIYGNDGRGLLEGKESNLGVKISIPWYDENKHFDHILIYRIHYSINGQNPKIDLICDLKLVDSNNSTFNIIDFGIQALQTITLEEYNSMSGIHIIPKTIESQNDYLFAGCIKNEEGILQSEDVLEWDARAYSCDWDGYFAVKNENGTGEVRFIIKRDGSEIKYVDPEDMKTEVHPENTDGYTDYVNMQIEKDKVTETDYAYLWPLFDEVSGTPRHGIYGGFGKNISWLFSYDTQTIEQNFSGERLDRNEINKSRRTLKRGELYRYGIVLYDKFGNASPVKWIADIRVPYEKENNHFYNTNGATCIGVDFRVRNLPKGISRYEIVRCNRTINDIKNISQGIISKPGRTYKFKYSNGIYEPTELYPFSPTGYMTAHDVTIKTLSNKIGDHDAKEVVRYSTDQNDGLYQFASPEICFQKDSFKQMVGNMSLKLKLVKWVYTNKINSGIFTWSDPLYYHKELVNHKDEKFHSLLHKDNYKDPQNIGGDLFKELYITNNDLILSGGFQGDESWTPDGEKQKLKTWIQNKRNSYAYAKLYNYNDKFPNSPNQPYNIKNIAFPTDSVLSDFAEGSGKSVNLTYKNNQTMCGRYSFCNWSVGTSYVLDGSGVVSSEKMMQVKDDKSSSKYHIYGVGGRCMLMDLGNIIRIHTDNMHNYTGGTYLCNLQHNVVPYGGYSKHAKESSEYYSYGNFNTSDSTNIIVRDGDCYIDIFEYVSMHKLYCPEDISTLPSISIIYAFPVETNINLSLTSGYEFSRSNDAYRLDLLIEPSNVYNGLIQSKPAYEYNSAYSSSAKARMFLSQLSDNDLYKTNFDYRIRHSNLKSNNEYIDSWLRFQSADYIDVDTKHGQVTNLKSHQNRLYFWLKDAVGLLSVNERTVMNTENNLPLIIGEGGVLTRYDYIDEHSGMYEDQFCTAQSPNLLYYFDDLNQTIKALQGGTIVDLPSSKNVKNIMLEYESDTNSPIMFFDNKYDEMIANILDGKSIVYNEKITAFTSLYDTNFDGVILFPDKTYLLKYKPNFKMLYIDHWNQLSNQGPTSFGKKLDIKLKYVVNKSITQTKVFDDQEIVTSNPNSANFNELNYTWTTDLNTSTTDQLDVTDREGNFRFAIPRSDNSTYGNRIRGKYMVCEIEGRPKDDKTSISYIITKLRGSFA